MIFTAFGDYKLPLYIYLTTIPIYFLGLTPTAVRLVSVIAGSLAIPGIYLLTRQLFNKILSPKTSHNASLLSAFLLAISPWHFFISRPALEANLALTLIIFGFWALLKGLTHPRFYLLSSILLSLSLHTYNTARVFVPLLLIAFFIIYRRRILNFNRQSLPIYSLILSVLIFISSSTLVGQQIFTGTGTARYSKLAILSDTAVYQIGQSRLHSPLSKNLARLRYNRPFYFLTKFSKNYFSYFTPSFLYQTHGAHKQFAITGQNLFTLPVTLLGLIGIVTLIIKYRSNSAYFLFSWFLISPVASALTADPPQALRPNPMIPAVILFATIGAFTLINFASKKSRVQAVIYTLILLICLSGYVRYINVYWTDYLTNYSQSWQYGYRQTIEYIDEHQADYSHIIFTKRYGEPHIFYAFFSRLDPTLLQPNNNNIRFKQSDWFWTDKIENIYFVNDWDIPSILTDTIPLESGGVVELKNSLLILSPHNLPTNITVLKTINFLDLSPAFIIATPK